MDKNDVSNFPESSPNHTGSTEPVTLLSAGNESGYYTVEEYNGVNIVTYIDYATRMSSTRQKNIILKSRKPKLPRWI